MLLLHVYVYVGVCGLPRERSSPGNERLSRHHSLSISVRWPGVAVAWQSVESGLWPLHPK